MLLMLTASESVVQMKYSGHRCDYLVRTEPSLPKCWCTMPILGVITEALLFTNAEGKKSWTASKNFTAAVAREL